MKNIMERAGAIRYWDFLDMNNTQVQIYAAPLPFSNKQLAFVADYGNTLAEMVDKVIPVKYQNADVAAIVMINGEPIAKEFWGSIKPKPSALINIRIVPTGGGGGGGKKNPIATLLSIAVLIAAPFLANAILGPAQFGTYIGIGKLTYGGLLSGAIGVVGRLAISALAGPPAPSNVGYAGNTSVKNPAESPTQFIEGAKNSLSPFGVIPVCLGTNRMFPLQAARPFTETEGSDQYVRQLFTYGYGEQLTVADVKIGQTEITEFDDVDIENKFLGNLHTGTDLYSDDVYQDDYSILLDFAGGYTLRTTQLNIDEAIVDFTLPQGLVRYTNSGGRATQTVEYEVQHSPAGAGTWTTAYSGTISASQKEALRKSHRIVFGANGQYDIRVKRLSPDATSDQVFDKIVFSAIKSVTYQNPVNLEGINGSAVRIKATDQLNGALDQLNALVTIHVPDYDTISGLWLLRETSNPASLYRYVLQGLPNAKGLPDSKIIIEDLEDWHTHCKNEGYTYNRVIDFETTVDAVLRDIASAGAASPAVVDGKRTVAIDRIKDEITQVITPRNSWGYSGEMIYPSLPHAFRIQFRNADKGYVQDERIVYDDGYDEYNATEFEVMELQSTTNADLAFKTGRRHIAAARLRPESHTWMMDIEHLVSLRGDRILLEHDAPIVGVGDGRIKSVQTLGESPDLVSGITLDDTIAIPTTGMYYVRIRLDDGSLLYKELTTVVGNTTALVFAVPFDLVDIPAAGDLCYVVEAGGELDLLITRIEPQDDMTARITAINYAQPSINEAENSPIPAFDSKVTTPLEFIRPLPPLLIEEQSDESVMLLNSDGSYIARAVFTLENRNEGNTTPFVKIRVAGTSQFSNASVIEATPESISIIGMEDGTRYDLQIRYKRSNSSMHSPALEINNYLFIGASTVPADVSTFSINVAGESALFKWTKNTELDIAYYTIKYSPLYAAASWATALILEEKVYENRFSAVFRGGTYLIKAVDILGNESVNATAIITHDPGTVANAIANISENPDFGGTHVNTIERGGTLILAADDALGYYYFEDRVNLGAVFPSIISANIVANGTYINDVFDFSDIFAEADIFGVGQHNIFDYTDLFAVEDVFGIGAGAWTVEIQYRITQTDPDDSPAGWGDWTALQDGILEFWAIEFRVIMTSLQQGISPQIQTLNILVDMQDRIERGEDLTVPVGGMSVSFTPDFRATPATAITIQDGAVDDKIEFTAKTAGGFTFKVYNETATTYVERTFDYIASGYGRKNE